MILFEKATYNYNSLMDCREAIQKLTKTVGKKNEYFAVACEYKKCFDFCFEKTKCFTFEFSYTVGEDFYKAAYDYKNHKTHELESLRRRTILYLEHEISEIYDAGIKGDVNLEYD